MGKNNARITDATLFAIIFVMVSIAAYYGSHVQSCNLDFSDHAYRFGFPLSVYTKFQLRGADYYNHGTNFKNIALNTLIHFIFSVLMFCVVKSFSYAQQKER